MDTAKYIQFPNFDTVIVHIYGPLALRWYSLAYILGIVLGWFYIKNIIKKHQTTGFTFQDLDDCVPWVVMGVVFGGRLGHVLFYDFMTYIQNPVEILQVWKGGMSFHGGLMGVIISLYIFAKRKGIPYWHIMDLMALTAPVGLGLGRIANFINGEIYGRITDVPWAVLFPAGGYLPRHPSQLYEAFLEGLILFALVNGLTLGGRKLCQYGYASGVFSMGYGAFRIFVEFFREPDGNLGYFFRYITMGQIISLPLILFGIYLIKQSYKTR